MLLVLDRFGDFFFENFSAGRKDAGFWILDAGYGMLDIEGLTNLCQAEFTCRIRQACRS
jgi:hypothetical protein